MQYFCSHVIELKKGTLPPLGISMKNDWAVVDLGIDRSAGTTKRGTFSFADFFELEAHLC